MPRARVTTMGCLPRSRMSRVLSVNPNGTGPSVTEAHLLDDIGVAVPHLLRLVPAAWWGWWRRCVDGRVIDRWWWRRGCRGSRKEAKRGAAENARSDRSAISSMCGERNGRQRRRRDAQSQKGFDGSTPRCRHVSSKSKTQTCVSCSRRAAIEAHSNFLDRVFSEHCGEDEATSLR
jgi:hypothetical protein